MLETTTLCKLCTFIQYHQTSRERRTLQTQSTPEKKNWGSLVQPINPLNLRRLD